MSQKLFLHRINSSISRGILQEKLESGQNIKTINDKSLLDFGNLSLVELDSTGKIPKNILPTLTASEIGLDQVNNTSDANKPVSNAVNLALSNFQPIAEKGAAGGYASLDKTGRIPLTQLPPNLGNTGALVFSGDWDAATNDPTIVSGSGINGQYYKVSVSGTTKIDSTTIWDVGDWIIFNGKNWDKISNSQAVESVNGKTGSIVLAAADIGLDKVENTTDAEKKISDATAIALSGKHPLMVSGTNIKTINGVSILGPGDLSLSTNTDLNSKQDVLVSGTNIKTINSSSILGAGNILLPTATDLNNKQDTLVSATNIRTINNQSLLGSGNLSVQPLLVSGTNIQTINGNSILQSGNIALPTSADLSAKQDALVSGTNIKTVNGQSLIGSGNVLVQAPLVSGTNISTINNQSLLGSSNIVVQTPLVSGVGIQTINGNSLLQSGNLVLATAADLNNKQDALVSSINIKTINGSSILGPGDLVVAMPVTAITPMLNLNYGLVAWYRCDGLVAQNFVLNGSNVQQWYSQSPHGAPILQIANTNPPTLSTNGVTTGQACISFTSTQGMGGTAVASVTYVNSISLRMPQSLGFSTYDQSTCYFFMMKLSWVKSTKTTKQCVFAFNKFSPAFSSSILSALRTSCFFKDIYYWDTDNTTPSLTTDATQQKPIYLPSNQWFCLTVRVSRGENSVPEVFINNSKYYPNIIPNSGDPYGMSMTVPFLFLNGYYLYNNSVGVWYQYGAPFQIREMKEYRTATPLSDNDVSSIVTEMHSRAGISVAEISNYNITQGYLLMQLKANAGTVLFASTQKVTSWTDVKNSLPFSNTTQSSAPTLVQNVFGTLPGIQFTTSTFLNNTAIPLDLPQYGPLAFFFVITTPATISTNGSALFRFGADYNWLHYPSATTMASFITTAANGNTSRTAAHTIAANTSYIVGVFLARYGVNNLVMSTGYTQKSIVTGTWASNNYNDALTAVSFYIGNGSPFTVGEIRMYYSGFMTGDHVQNIFSELSTTYNIALV